MDEIYVFGSDSRPLFTCSRDYAEGRIIKEDLGKFYSPDGIILNPVKENIHHKHFRLRLEERLGIHMTKKDANIFTEFLRALPGRYYLKVKKDKQVKHVISKINHRPVAVVYDPKEWNLVTAIDFPSSTKALDILNRNIEKLNNIANFQTVDQ